MDKPQTKTHWKRLVNPDFIGAYALNPDEDLTVTIDYVRREEIVGTGGKKEECTVAHLVGHKPLILNATNSKSIHKLYGPYIEEWAGKQITLFASTAKLAGDVVECLRIRPNVARQTKPKIMPDRLKKAIASIVAGQYTTEKLRAQFDLTDAQEKEVAEAVKKAVEGNNVPN